MAYQPWLTSERPSVGVGNEAAIMLEKQKMAQNERLAREAARAKAAGEKDEGKDYYKTISGLDENWLPSDIPVRNALHKKLTDIVYGAQQNYSDPNFQRDFTQALGEYKAAQDVSSKVRDLHIARGSEVAKNPTNSWENLDKLSEFQSGKYTVKDRNPDGTEADKTYDINEISKDPDAVNKFFDLSAKRIENLQSVKEKWNKGSYMSPFVSLAINKSQHKVSVPDGKGNQIETIETDPQAYDDVISTGWVGSPKLQEEYTKQFKEDSQGFSSPEALYKAEYGYTMPKQYKETPKKGGISKNDDGSFSIAGIKYNYYNNGDGTERILMASEKGGDLPPQTVKTKEGKNIVAAPYAWDINKQGTPVLIVRETIKETGEPDTWTEHEVDFKQAEKFGLKYQSPQEALIQLGIKKETRATQNPTQVNVAGTPQTGAPSAKGGQKTKTLSSGRTVYSDDGGKTWHP